MKSPRRSLRCARIAAFCAGFVFLLAGIVVAESVTLESADGRKIEAELVERGEDRVKIRVGRRVYVLPYDKLAPASVALVKAADVPVMCDFEIVADLNKRGDKKERVRTERKLIGEEWTTVYETDSYRVDEVDGVIKVKNGDVAASSPAGTLHIAVLANGAGGHKVMLLEQHKLNSLDPLETWKFEVKKSYCWHSERGRSFNTNATMVKGRYSGYIAAIVMDGRIVALKSSPGSYEDEEKLREVRAMLKIGRGAGPAKR